MRINCDSCSNFTDSDDEPNEDIKRMEEKEKLQKEEQQMDEGEQLQKKEQQIDEGDQLQKKEQQMDEGDQLQKKEQQMDEDEQLQKKEQQIDEGDQLQKKEQQMDEDEQLQKKEQQMDEGDQLQKKEQQLDEGDQLQKKEQMDEDEQLQKEEPQLQAESRSPPELEATLEEPSFEESEHDSEISILELIETGNKLDGITSDSSGLNRGGQSPMLPQVRTRGTSFASVELSTKNLLGVPPNNAQDENPAPCQAETATAQASASDSSGLNLGRQSPTLPQVRSRGTSCASVEPPTKNLRDATPNNAQDDNLAPCNGKTSQASNVTPYSDEPFVSGALAPDFPHSPTQITASLPKEVSDRIPSTITPVDEQFGIILLNALTTVLDLLTLLLCDPDTFTFEVLQYVLVGLSALFFGRKFYRVLAVENFNRRQRVESILDLALLGLNLFSFAFLYHEEFHFVFLTLLGLQLLMNLRELFSAVFSSTRARLGHISFVKE